LNPPKAPERIPADAREALARLKSSRFARILLRSTIVLLCDM
jgi:hypothetical protein